MNAGEQVSIELIADLYNSETGEQHELEVHISKAPLTAVEAINGNLQAEHWKEIFYELFDCPVNGVTGTEGILYSQVTEIVTRAAFDKLGWHDVTAQVRAISIGAKKVELIQSDLDILSDELGFQLVREDRSMYFYA